MSFFNGIKGNRAKPMKLQQNAMRQSVEYLDMSSLVTPTNS